MPQNAKSVACPYCKAKRGHDCISPSGATSVIHLARIKAAKGMTREDMNQVAARIVRQATEKGWADKRLTHLGYAGILRIRGYHLGLGSVACRSAAESIAVVPSLKPTTIPPSMRSVNVT